MTEKVKTTLKKLYHKRKYYEVLDPAFWDITWQILAVIEQSDKEDTKCENISSS